MAKTQENLEAIEIANERRATDIFYRGSLEDLDKIRRGKLPPELQKYFNVCRSTGTIKIRTHRDFLPPPEPPRRTITATYNITDDCGREHSLSLPLGTKTEIEGTYTLPIDRIALEAGKRLAFERGWETFTIGRIHPNTGLVFSQKTYI